MEVVFLKVFNMGFTASWLILAVLFLRIVLRKAPKWAFCLLWALVAFKLVCPFSIESALSLIPSNEPLPENVITGNTFQVNTGIGLVDVPVNKYLGDHYYEGVSVPADNGSHMMYALGIFWIAGFILLLAYGFFSYYRLYRITRISVWLKEDIFLCDTIDFPFILGIVRPCIFLPSGMDAEQMKYVTAHEKAHLRRRDHWWKPLGFLLLCIYWFQPLCWLSYILFCRDIELACDERVVRELGQESKKPYAEALLSCSVKQSAAAACPLAFGEVGVKERVKNVLRYKKPAFWIVLAAGVCCVVVAACFLTSPGKKEGASKEQEAAPKGDEAVLEEAYNRAEQHTKENADGRDMVAGDREEAVYDMLARWRKIYCERDAEAIADMAAPELAEEMLMGSEGSYSFGISSPWPWDWETDSYVYDYNEERAEIYYYAHTSDPHITCWKEDLKYTWENDGYVITEAETVCYDDISTGAEFEEAYHGQLDGTMMDYTANGLGENLNNNALLFNSMAYRDLFEPESAAAFLLNLSDDQSDVRFTLHEPEGSGLIGLDIAFLRDQKTYTISMFQPYGENGIWVPVDYRVDAVARFMDVPWEQVENIRFTGDMSDVSGIVCIGEIPERKIKVYGYNDEETGFRGVAVEIGEDVNYFDWVYASPRLILPDLYWDEGRRQLQITCYIYAGTGMAAEELHVLQQYDTGTLQESNFGLNDYSSLLENRISYRFDEEKRELVLIDTKTGEELAAAAVPEEAGRSVSGLELGMISGFELGKEVYLCVSPGYYMDGVIGAAEYEGIPELRFKVDVAQGENGDIIGFDLGDRV